ncbi:hypothetical protein NDU88_004265 [Pleurodeles waltl]|uniref:Uncharacterized protein n=1 Tax=Pleurodeles waltl TaxID=8319 RepID=A0AAV7TRD6_PLEWA|nr:hypothetical protein NDU88_004519 [Pleurodeles waltl]KAJ1179026.1 hypothetical protein NDU88_004265 [Pleurodeles waltl]
MSCCAKLVKDFSDVNENSSTEAIKNYSWLETVYNDFPSGAANIMGADSASEDTFVKNDNPTREVDDDPTQEVEVSDNYLDHHEKNGTYRSKLGRNIKKPLHLKDYIVD